MADDDKGGKPGTSVPAEHPPEGRDDGPLTEWTASDRRGPLDAADHAEVERVVPAHEMDAEGIVDPVADETSTMHGTAVNAAEALPAHDDLPRSSLRDSTHPDENAHQGSFRESDNDALRADGAAATTVSSNSSRPVGEEPASSGRGRSLAPVAAGLVVGALIGAGSAWLVYSQAGDGGAKQQMAALSSRVDALDKRPDPQPEVTKLQSGVSDLQGKVAAIEKQVTGSSKVAVTANPQPREPLPQASAPNSSKPQQQAVPGQPAAVNGSNSADAGAAGKIASLQAALDKLETRTAALQAQGGKDADAKKQAVDAQKQAETAQSALDAVKGEQKQLGDKLAGLTIAVAGALKKADGAEKQAADAQSGLDSIGSKQKALEGKLGSPALAVVTDSLVQQIAAGQSYGRQVDALASLKADPAKISVLRENATKGVPSAQALLAKWKPLADPVIATGNNAPAGANFGQRLEHGLFGLVSVRRNDGTAGNDITSRASLIESDLSHDDVPGAFEVWQKLPDPAKAKSQEWGALAKTSVKALGAARDLQHSAIDALGASRS